MPRKSAEVTPATEAVEAETAATQNVIENFIDHQRKAIEEAGKAIAALVPSGLREHGENAVKEMVEGYRTLLNSTLDEIIKAVERAKVEDKIIEQLENVKVNGETKTE